MKITVCDDAFEIAKVAARELLNASQTAMGEGRRCSVALSGGTTPKYLYEELVSEVTGDSAKLTLLKNVDWFFSDERFVPPSDPQSNYWLANNFLFSKIEFSEESVFKVPTENIAPENAAQKYEAMIAAALPTKKSGVPVFDLVFLGMGDDGHTASLFPGTELVERICSAPEALALLVASHWVAKANMHRITFMPRLINKGAAVIIMASGIKKAAVLESVLEGAYAPSTLPVQLVRPVSGNLTWLIDKEAAHNLP